MPMDVDIPFDSTGLKEIGNLASWTVSTYKPGCGVEALRDDDTNLFWQYVFFTRHTPVFNSGLKSLELCSLLTHTSGQTDPNPIT